MGKSHRRSQRDSGLRKNPNESFLEFQQRIRKVNKKKRESDAARSDGSV
jgi:hypothetical protein